MTITSVPFRDTPLNRRSLLKAATITVGAVALGDLFPAWAKSGSHGLHALAGQSGVVSGDTIELSVGQSAFKLGKKTGHAYTVNGTLPGPLVRLREGQNVKLIVRNTLQEDTSVHWHGMLLPFQMDGVPGISFPGIGPGESFTYEFPMRQHGTYWYHSHSHMQEAMGMYGALIVDPAAADPIKYDREHILVLSDWSFAHAHTNFTRQKQKAGYFNKRKQTMAGLLKGKDQPLSERVMWGQMLMDPTDIADVTGAYYHYLINGHDSMGNWTGIFKPGERVRLRIINAAAMSNFNIRVPGLPMTIVAADGLPLTPVETDEFQIAVAETWDVIIEPKEAIPFAFIAESIDRSGQCRATLAPQMGMVAPIPELRERPLLTMKDMGMDHGSGGGGMAGMDHSKMTPEEMAAMDGSMGAMDHGSMNMRDPSVAPQVKMGPGVASLAPMPMDRNAERPTGLEKVPHRVLTLSQLRALELNPDTRKPSREIDVHLTANMERYMWSMDGESYTDKTEPLPFRHNERVRVNLINHTMMPHPIHLHGHFFEIVNGQKGQYPRKNVVNVLPGAKVTFDFTADAMGDWAFHCHMLMHMHAGMFRVVTVRHEEGGE
jgi:CopA family copper-resistance protein